VSRPRLIAVCGYSDGAGEELHEICARRLRRAEREARADDVVLLTGWARGRSAASEAELMARSWAAPCRRVVVDSSARSTFANVAAAASVAREVGAGRVVLVTSGWHAGRAAALLRGALRGSGSTVELATTDERPSLRARFRELVCWALVPLAAVAARAQLLAGWSGCSGCSGWSVLDADGGESADGADASTVSPSTGGPCSS
jgi:uncharacterized SAM-binding protein YcdF (DUF218 family)